MNKEQARYMLKGETRLNTNIFNNKNIQLLQKRSQTLTIYTTT